MLALVKIMAGAAAMEEASSSVCGTSAAAVVAVLERCNVGAATDEVFVL